MARIILAIAVLWAATPAWSHSLSDAYLLIEPRGQDFAVTWSVAVRDLDLAVGVDPDGDGLVTWGELRGRKAAIEGYAMTRLRLAADGAECVPGPVSLLADNVGAAAYAVLRFSVHCAGAEARRLSVRYKLLFELDPLHRGLLTFVSGDGSREVALSPSAPEAQFDLPAPAPEGFLGAIARRLSGQDASRP